MTFICFAIAILNKTGNSWKSLHSVISKISENASKSSLDKELSFLIKYHGIQDDELWHAENILERVKADRWQVSFYSASDYPEEWLQYGEKSPPLIFFKGTPLNNISLWCAIVGTTQPDFATIDLVRKTVEFLIEFKCGIVTGGAPGVDSIAVESALLHNIPVRVILPMGILHYTPHNSILKATEQGICQIISPWTPNSRWSKSQAVRRNSLIAFSSSVGFIFNPSHEGGSYRVAKNLFSRELPVFVHMPDKYAWHLRYSKLVYPIPTDLNNANTEVLKKILFKLSQSPNKTDNCLPELL
ncbi:MAG: DNA-protecting protein DprA [Candidatus Hydrogenedentes bacterium]|nr:DNA-protecting protein DprA [Candidatus Hydrogenedentota bacterium]